MLTEIIGHMLSYHLTDIGERLKDNYVQSRWYVDKMFTLRITLLIYSIFVAEFQVKGIGFKNSYQ